MPYGDRALGKGDRGADVVELQMRLAGFRGTLPDGIFGPGTELQVLCFQRDWMGLTQPHGRVDSAGFDAIEAFAAAHPIDFEALKCPCGLCGGFGRGKYKGRYRDACPRVEAYYCYEYPGVHRMLLWAYRAAVFYCRQAGLEIIVTSGYRCAERNRQKGRQSTNHHGKAIDFDIATRQDKRDEMAACERIRGVLVERANAQIGWSARNRKALEPNAIAPTWVHYDVRSYERTYLAESHFVRDPESLDRAVAV
ncbi:MAG TPA: peptidoglycan-binding domain-containing protein [Kiloniellaceae bacterium]|nr:peptidoglycan-binding domain-containing protein [Kiloniellaceae bacterium]